MSALPPFSRTKALQCQQSDFYYMATRMALQFAILGQTQLARRIVSKLNDYDYFHGHHVALLPLHLLWMQQGMWPEGEEERARESIMEDRKRQTEKAGEQEEQERAGNHARIETQGRPVTRSDVKIKVEKLASDWAKSWYWPDRLRTPLEELHWRKSNKTKGIAPDPSTMTPSEAHAAIQEIMTAVKNMEPKEHKYVQTGVVAMDVSSALVNALDIRLRFEWQDDHLEGIERLPTVDEILAMIAKNLNSNQQVETLAQSQRAWRILSRGALAEILDIDAKKLGAYAKEAEQIIDERLTNGRQQPAESTVLEILQKIDRNSRTNPKAERGSSSLHFDSDKTLFRDPATAQQIKETERSLGTQLPADYKEFLSVTNGFGPAFSGIILEPPLSPLSDIRWLKDDEDYFTDLYLDMPGRVFMSIRPRGFDGEPDWTKVGKAVQVGSEDIFELWLIRPRVVEDVKTRVNLILNREDNDYDEKAKASLRHMVEDFAGSWEEFLALDWAFLTWASGGMASMQAYPSFKAYLMHVAENGVKDDGDALSERNFIGYSMLRADSTSRRVGIHDDRWQQL
ncbi:ribosome-recycling factor [Didymella pomorum]|uniref:Ribosome-recycling factor n=1 Tax=Didymella pomorum TaxID=749634 RepID=A0A9W8ZAR4_9PLEO|nr:ribosome-recycling factor [Didymella pomorum]